MFQAFKSQLSALTCITTGERIVFTHYCILFIQQYTLYVTQHNGQCSVCFISLQQELKDLSSAKAQAATELSEAKGKIHVCCTVVLLHFSSTDIYIFQMNRNSVCVSKNRIVICIYLKLLDLLLSLSSVNKCLWY